MVPRRAWPETGSRNLEIRAQLLACRLQLRQIVT